MEIRWFGHSFFAVTTSTNVQKDVKVFFDPFSEEIGLKTPKELEADVVLVSHNHFDHNNVSLFQKVGIVLNTAGEYSVKGVDIKGILAYHDKSFGQERGANIIFTLESEGIKVAHLGDLGHVPDDSQKKALGQIDILFLPVGAKNAISLQEAMSIIKELSPKIIIPMHYKIPGLKLEIGGLEPFCKEIGTCPLEPQRKLVVKPSTLEGKEMEVVVLEQV